MSRERHILAAVCLCVAAFDTAFSFSVFHTLERLSRFLPADQAKRSATGPMFTPQILPLSVNMQRTNGNSATVTFQVKHSVPLLAGKPLHTLQDTDPPLVRVSATQGAHISQVSFTIPLDWCPPATKAHNHRNILYAPFLFASPDPHDNNAMVSLNLCYFDINPQYLDRMMNDMPLEGVPVLTAGPFTDNIQPAGVTIEESARDQVFQDGQNVTFQVTLDLSRDKYYYISFVFYDSIRHKLLGTDAFIHQFERVEIERYDLQDGNRDLWAVSQVDGSDDPASTRLQVSVNTASGRYTGMIHVTSDESFDGPHAPTGVPIVLRSGLDVPIYVRKSDQAVPLPEGKYIFRQLPNMVCTDKGNEFFNRGPNCSVPCHVNGLGIQRVRIYKEGGVIGVDQTKSEIFPLFAKAYLDLGPVSDDIAGTYVCEVEGRHGVVDSWTTRMMTAEQPEIQVNSSGVFPGPGDLLTVRCVVTGEPVPDIRFYFDYNTGGFNPADNANFTVQQTSLSQGQSYTVTFDPTEVEWPPLAIECRARNNLGNVNEDIPVHTQ